MGKYDALAEWLAASGKEVVSLTFDEISEVIRSPLTSSGRQYPAFWANPAVGLPLARAGYRARSRLGEGRVEFIRMNASPPALLYTTPTLEATTGREIPDLLLLGCVKTKLPGIHRAKDIYRSELFMGRRRYAESLGVAWFILSAKHGLIAPEDEIESYDVALLDLSSAERMEWGRRVLNGVDQKIDSLMGKLIEIHAGAEYREYGVRKGLEARGARVVIPLEHLGIGRQLAWYQAPWGHQSVKPRPSIRAEATTTQTPADTAQPACSLDEARHLTTALSGDFFEGTLELSARIGAPIPGWPAMPECVAVSQLRAAGASDVDIRLVLTLVAAMDRARDADRLWQNATRLFQSQPWAFHPESALGRPLYELKDVLAASGVSQRHSSDSGAWRLILEAIASESSPAAVRRVIFEGVGEAADLRRSVAATRPSGLHWFPLLSGPKISVLWIRMLADPGHARIDNIGALPVAVDVQVRKVTEYLGITATKGRDLEEVRQEIQRAWMMVAESVKGSPSLTGTCAALDPALWFFGKWGCTFCEKAQRRMPISKVCGSCRYGE